jgi:biotin carboxyl carrier protein
MALENIESEMVGIVREIVVGVGDEVSEEDPIIIMESMKMEIPVLSPEDGVVKEIRVAAGDSVKKGQVIAVLEI